MIGCGRQAFGCNLTPFLYNAHTQVVAACDVDAWRLEKTQTSVNNYYAGKTGEPTWKGCKTCRDFRELLADPDIDAVMISTPITGTPSCRFWPQKPGRTSAAKNR
jgi:predicted dehydrogenase